MVINLIVRPFQESDYAGIADVLNAAWPDEAHSAGGLLEDDTTHDPKVKRGRLVAQIDQQIVGEVHYTQFEGMYHPQKFGAWITVKPQFRGQGIGKALYAQLLKTLEPFDPIEILSTAREDQTHALAWLQKLGFVEKMRFWESRLDVPAFDFTPYAGKIEAVEAAGFELKSLKELQDDPEYKAKTYDLWLEVREDVPHPGEITEVSFEDYCAWVFKSSYFLPEGFFMAVDKTTGQFVALSTLWKTDGDYLSTGLTGTRRAYRRKGLALALKLKALRFGKEYGAKELRTGNESGNRAMLAINEALGFVKQPIWADFIKTLKEDS